MKKTISDTFPYSNFFTSAVVDFDRFNRTTIRWTPYTFRFDCFSNNENHSKEYKVPSLKMIFRQEHFMRAGKTMYTCKD